VTRATDMWLEPADDDESGCEEKVELVVVRVRLSNGREFYLDAKGIVDEEGNVVVLWDRILEDLEETGVHRSELPIDA